VAQGEFKKEMETLQKHGYTRRGSTGAVNLDDRINLDKRKNTPLKSLSTVCW